MPLSKSEPLPQIDLIRTNAEICRKSLFEFVKEFWSVIIAEDPVWNWHIEYLCDIAQEEVLRVCRYKHFDATGQWVMKQRENKLHDTIANIPPGSSKSTIFTVMLPAWAWTVDSTLRIMTASYSQSLSTDHALKSRDIIQSAKYKAYFGDVQIKQDQNNKTHYKNNMTGERYATSVGGTITGFHAHLIIVDDPLNAGESASEVALDTANAFMNTTLSTRKVNKAVTPIFLIMQRLHENDPTGNWTKKKGKRIRHICLPAKVNDAISPPEAAAYYLNGLLDPIRMDEDVLEEAQIDLGSYGYAGQFDQKPAPEDGEIWKRWFIPIPDHLCPTIAQMEKYGSDWDTAYTEKKTNAASAVVASGKINDPEYADGRYTGKMFIDNVAWFNLEFPALIKKMKEYPSPHYIEAKASGKSAKQTLVAAQIAAIEVQVNADKIARARDATPKAEAGLVCIRASLLDKVYNDSEQGILKFPKGEKMDLADTIAQAIMRHYGNVRELSFGGSKL